MNYWHIQGLGTTCCQFSSFYSAGMMHERAKATEPNASTTHGYKEQHCWHSIVQRQLPAPWLGPLCRGPSIPVEECPPRDPEIQCLFRVKQTSYWHSSHATLLHFLLSQTRNIHYLGMAVCMTAQQFRISLPVEQ